MKEVYFRVDIETKDLTQKEILIAMLSDLGFEGFEEDRALLKAFVHAGDFKEEELVSLTESMSVSYTLSQVENKNWNEAWESSFEPVIVEDFCAVRAAFHEPVKGVKHEIIVTPKMSFGTGHHATTYMMILAMRELSFLQKKVFDFGTGTGVLAILAEKCGASNVEAIDNDDWSIENAMENILANHCHNIRLHKAENIDGVGSADIILANINRNVILQFMQQLKNLLLPGGVILFSGLLAADEEEVEKQAVSAGLILKNKFEQHTWICLQYVTG